jgi:hypothetical protein
MPSRRKALHNNGQRDIVPCPALRQYGNPLLMSQW